MLARWQVTKFRKVPQDELMALSARIKAILYARVSTADQAEHGYSLASQVERCAQWARHKFGYGDQAMLAVVEPGVSGDDPNRPALNQVLYLLEQGVGRKVVVLHPDRLSRDLHLQHSVWRKVLGLGIDLEFVEVDFDPNNPESMLMFNIQGSIAQYNKAKILANSRRGRKQKVKNGKIPGLRRVYGYTYDKEADTLVENPKEKRIYLLAVDWLLRGHDGRGMTCNAVAAELARLGVPGPGGMHWYGANLARILRNELYTGTFAYGKTEVARVGGKRVQVAKPRAEWLTAPVPAFIDHATYEQILAALAHNFKGARGRPSGQYLLRKLVRCGRCGCAVVAGPRSVHSGQVRHYYMCCNKGKKSFAVGTGMPVGRCRGRNWRQDAVDGAVWRFLLARLPNLEPVIAEVLRQQGDGMAVAGIQARQAELERAVADKRKVRARYVEMYALGILQAAAELQQKLEPVDRQLAELEQEAACLVRRLEQAAAAPGEGEQIQSAVRRFRRAAELDAITWAGRRVLVERLVRRVTLHEDNTIEILVTWPRDLETGPETPFLQPSSR